MDATRIMTEADGIIAAHMLAYRNAKILHRDVSIGNMLIVEREVGGPDGSKLQRRGLLTDWELSKSLDENDQRQPHRTVTGLKVNLMATC